MTDASQNETLWTLTDNLGSVKDVVDSAGNLRIHRQFDSFGNTVSETHYDAGSNVVTAGQAGYVTIDLGYTGKMLEVHTGLQYNNARWLDLRTGSWISKDFVWDGTNRYAYVGNQPTTFLDPTGLEGWSVHGTPPPGYGSPIRTTPTGGKPSLGYFFGVQYFGRAIQIAKLNDEGDLNKFYDCEEEFRRAFAPDIRMILVQLGSRHKASDSGLTFRGGLPNVAAPGRKDGRWIWPTYENFDTGWWLNGAHRVDAEFQYTLKNEGGTLRMTNIKTRWIWRDVIDANGCQAWAKQRPTLWSKLKGAGNLIVEALIADKVIDGFLDADFRVEINSGWLPHPDIDTKLPIVERH